MNNPDTSPPIAAALDGHGPADPADSAGAAGAAGPTRRLRLAVRGAVQGVGFRPYVYRLAVEHELTGWVSNDPQGVSLEVEGTAEQVEAFRRRLPEEAPPLAVIHAVEVELLEPLGGGSGPATATFAIRASATEGAKTAVVLPDAATCPACLDEVLDPANRRHGYPFTNCTHCGPRYTIVRGLPYDRPSTTMAGFRMCPACRSEYQDPLDRRFHAQPNACPECGPRVELWDRRGRVVMPAGESAAVIRLAAGAVRSGAVLALKGLGGFQLLVDATDSGAVATLRERKRRDAKPFALMVRDLDQARSLCRVSDAEAALLSSVQAPIVLIRRHAYRRSQPPLVAEGVAPGNPWLGLMLPTTPLHHLLLREIGRPVVATSGNLTDEPIATDELDAVERLGALADLFLVHDRPIARHADDSVARVVRGEARVLRRARGYAPMPVLLPIDGNRSDRGGAGDLPTVLAVGAHLKNTVALAIAGRVYVSQHLGDMETPRALDAFERVVADFLDLYDASPVVVAHDLHPDYATTRVALRLAAEIEARTGRPVVRVAVQHHHAHLAACLAENGRFGRDCRALGVIWDGTGFGTDRTVWGGELLVGDAASFRRVARLRPFRLPGGDAAVKEPRRSALALLVETLGPAALERDDLAPVASFSAAERRLLGRMLETGTRAPVTTSAGRLFDGVAALTGLAPTGAGAAGRVSFEGQAALALELAADRAAAETLSGDSPPADAYPLPVVETGAAEVAWELDWRPLVEAILADLGSSGRGSDAGAIGVRFHGALIRAIVEVARRVGEPVVALSGGCFQNRLLTEWGAAALERAGFEVLLHRQVPPNDGGISFGQVAVACARHTSERTTDGWDEEGAPCA